MAKHTISISEDKVTQKVRLVCACTYTVTTSTRAEAKSLAGKHLQDVVNKMKPQKTLDLGDHI